MGLFWQLNAATGATTLEPPQHASIRLAPSDSVRLVVIEADGSPIVQVPLIEDGVAYRPVFYRRRSQMPGEASSRLDAVVFGRGRESGARIDSTLWAVVNGRIVDCPSTLIDTEMIDLQVRGVN